MDNLTPAPRSVATGNLLLDFFGGAIAQAASNPRRETSRPAAAQEKGVTWNESLVESQSIFSWSDAAAKRIERQQRLFNKLRRVAPQAWDGSELDALFRRCRAFHAVPDMELLEHKLHELRDSGSRRNPPRACRRG